MKPSVGRVVHYCSHGTPGGEYGKECRAAIVTEVLPDQRAAPNDELMPKVGLCVLNPTGQFFSQDVPYDNGHYRTGELTHLCRARNYQGGTWHWAEGTETREHHQRP